MIVEIVFFTNPAERKQLITKKRQEEIAKSLADGIMEYLKSAK